MSIDDPALVDERDFLLRSLDDLDREHAAGDLPDDEYAELRRGYVQRTAAVQRQLDGDGVQPEDAPRSRTWLAWIGGSVVVAVVLGLLLARFSGERFNSDSPTGGIPENIAGLLTEARTLTGQQRLDEAVKRYIDVLRTDPDNAEALTYRGWLLVQLGDGNNVPEFVADGIANLDRAVEVAPTYSDARALRGIVAFRFEDNPQRAVDEFNALFDIPDAPVQQLAMVLETEAEARQAIGMAPRDLQVDAGPPDTSAG
jgi:tetratricopeptide (TPR) repeat protein